MMYYERLVSAVRHYEQRGFTYREVPWAVPWEVHKITCPDKRAVDGRFPFRGDYLVASGEQSLLALIEAGELHPGKYQTITPCFRGDAVDATHQSYFLKNELMVFNPPEGERDALLAQTVAYCRELFELYARRHGAIVDVVPSGSKSDPDELDITVNGIEVGSYGIRYHKDYCWIYATGLAEPRLSIAHAHEG